MPRRLNLPDSASLAMPGAGDKLCAPSAERNAGPLCDLLEAIAPASGHALELASGTGQHAVLFARRLPGLAWQPSEIDPGRLRSIAAHAAEAALPNLAAPVPLDATAPGWGKAHGGQDLIVLVNLLHLISEGEAATVIAEAAQALAAGGLFVVYGPFRRAGELTSAGDRAFDESLRAQDPEIGYKDDFDVIDTMHGAGLELAHAIEMPANNLVLAARR